MFLLLSSLRELRVLCVLRYHFVCAADDKTGQQEHERSQARTHTRACSAHASAPSVGCGTYVTPPHFMFYVRTRAPSLEQNVKQEVALQNVSLPNEQSQRSCLILLRGTYIAVIPGNLTGMLQPLDVSVNHPFKGNSAGNRWNGWQAAAMSRRRPDGSRAHRL